MNVKRKTMLREVTVEVQAPVLPMPTPRLRRIRPVHRFGQVVFLMERADGVTIVVE
jgi:hypothetical protein